MPDKTEQFKNDIEALKVFANPGAKDHIKQMIKYYNNNANDENIAIKIYKKFFEIGEDGKFKCMFANEVYGNIDVLIDANNNCESIKNKIITNYNVVGKHPLQLQTASKCEEKSGKTFLHIDLEDKGTANIYKLLLKNVNQESKNTPLEEQNKTVKQANNMLNMQFSNVKNSIVGDIKFCKIPNTRNNSRSNPGCLNWQELRQLSLMHMLIIVSNTMNTYNQQFLGGFKSNVLLKLKECAPTSGGGGMDGVVGIAIVLLVVGGILMLISAAIAGASLGIGALFSYTPFMVGAIMAGAGIAILLATSGVGVFGGGGNLDEKDKQIINRAKILMKVMRIDNDKIFIFANEINENLPEEINLMVFLIWMLYNELQFSDEEIKQIYDSLVTGTFKSLANLSKIMMMHSLSGFCSKKTTKKTYQEVYDLLKNKIFPGKVVTININNEKICTQGDNPDIITFNNLVIPKAELIKILTNLSPDESEKNEFISECTNNLKNVIAVTEDATIQPVLDMNASDLHLAFKCLINDIYSNNQKLSLYDKSDYKIIYENIQQTTPKRSTFSFLKKSPQKQITKIYYNVSHMGLLHTLKKCQLPQNATLDVIKKSFNNSNNININKKFVSLIELMIESMKQTAGFEYKDWFYDSRKDFNKNTVDPIVANRLLTPSYIIIPSKTQEAGKRKARYTKTSERVVLPGKKQARVVYKNVRGTKHVLMNSEYVSLKKAMRTKNV